MNSGYEKQRALIGLVDSWTNSAGEIYSYVLKNEEVFKELKKTIVWQLIRSVAEGQETLHTVAEEAAEGARSNHHISG
jgi:hypothetical protein